MDSRHCPGFCGNIKSCPEQRIQPEKSQIVYSLTKRRQEDTYTWVHIPFLSSPHYYVWISRRFVLYLQKKNITDVPSGYKPGNLWCYDTTLRTLKSEPASLIMVPARSTILPCRSFCTLNLCPSLPAETAGNDIS